MPGNPGNENGHSRIPRNEKGGPGMDSLELTPSNSLPGSFLCNQSCLQVFSRTNELLVANLTVDELSAQPGFSRAADDILLLLIRRPMTKKSETLWKFNMPYGHLFHCLHGLFERFTNYTLFCFILVHAEQ